MSVEKIVVNSASDLFLALEKKNSSIFVDGVLKDLPAFKLPAGISLQGASGAILKFKVGQPGISLGVRSRMIAHVLDE